MKSTSLNGRFYDKSGCKIIQNPNPDCVHRAGWVIVTPWNILENGYVRVENSRIVEVGTDYSGTDGIDHGSGVLMPGFINAHTHLELSALQGKLPFDRGFKSWVSQLLVQREKLGTSTLRGAAKRGIYQILKSGCVGVGEISTLGITRDLMADSGLSGVWFQEMLGSSDAQNDADLDIAFDAARVLSFSLAGHAPHTSSPSLLTWLKKESALLDLPFSIHSAESPEESRFIRTGKGEWADFLIERGIDFSAWPLPARTPVQYLDTLNLLDPLTLAVHLLDVDNKDIQILKDRQVKTVVCPRSNFNLHARLPDIKSFLDQGLTPALGTDSLASTDSLSMADEMAFVAENYQDISPDQILAMATCYGASALGIDKDLGTLEPGRRARLVYIPLGANTPETLLETITHNE